MQLPLPFRTRGTDRKELLLVAGPRTYHVELPPRVEELAGRHGFHVSALSIRNQSTRWGACSPAGRISLNWRLIQMPPGVRDYVILHELVHIQHLNHSARFWRALERLCPGYKEARRWLVKKA